MPSPDAYGRLKMFLESVPEPRRARGLRHPVADVLFIVLVAVICGAEDAEAIEDFAKQNKAWFAKRCKLRHGIPSQDTYLRVLAAMDPKAFASAFERWVVELWGVAGDRHIAIDGKTLRRSFDRAAGESPVHSVAAYASAQGLVLGHVRVDAKANEIVAIPKLLTLIDLTGATVTMDAMGCQTTIAKAVVDGGGDYVLHVKDNHPTLKRQIAGAFTDAHREDRPKDQSRPTIESYVETDAGHGRIETRRVELMRDLSWLDDRASWANLSAIIKVSRRRELKATGAVTEDHDFYIASHAELTAKRAGELIRAHWSIENELHWVLDVTFAEDGSRIRTAHAAENLATIRRAGFNLLKTAPSPKKGASKVSIARRRRICAMNHRYRETVLRLLDPTAT
jgi:predicted transposase YbfD/YdcC